MRVVVHRAGEKKEINLPGFDSAPAFVYEMIAVMGRIYGKDIVTHHEIVYRFIGTNQETGIPHYRYIGVDI